MNQETTRINTVNAVIGRRGCGKTFLILQLIRAYKTAHPSQKILIVDTLDHPSYRHIPNITVEMLDRWKSPALYRIYGSNTDEIFNAITNKMYNALLIFEDASKYIRDRINDDTRAFIFDSKQKNLDIIFLFHGFSFAPPDIWRLVDNITLFKCDNPQGRKNFIPNYDEVKSAYDLIMKSDDAHENKTIRIY